MAVGGFISDLWAKPYFASDLTPFVEACRFCTFAVPTCVFASIAYWSRFVALDFPDLACGATGLCSTDTFLRHAALGMP